MQITAFHKKKRFKREFSAISSLRKACTVQREPLSSFPGALQRFLILTTIALMLSPDPAWYAELTSAAAA